MSMPGPFVLIHTSRTFIQRGWCHWLASSSSGLSECRSAPLFPECSLVSSQLFVLLPLHRSVLSSEDKERTRLWVFSVHNVSSIVCVSHVLTLVSPGRCRTSCTQHPLNPCSGSGSAPSSLAPIRTRKAPAGWKSQSQIFTVRYDGGTATMH